MGLDFPGHSSTALADLGAILFQSAVFALQTEHHQPVSVVSRVWPPSAMLLSLLLPLLLLLLLPVAVAGAGPS